MRENDIRTKELPYAPEILTERRKKIINIAGTAASGIYGILFTALASVGATVLLNQNLRDALLESIKNMWGGS